MGLKILIVPSLVIAILFLGIGFVKPDADVIYTKKNEISIKQAQMEKVDMVLSNIDTLNNSLETRRESEKFVHRYLPETISQDQVIDAFNYLALQSGLSIVKMELTQLPEPVREEPVVDPAMTGYISGSGSLGNSSVIPITPIVNAKTFVFTGSVRGSYENIKKFYDSVIHMDRYQRTNFFSIEESKQVDEAGKEIETSDLLGMFEAEFGYLPPKHTASALELPVFLQSKIDFSNLDKLMTTWVTSSVPALEKGQSGRPNPFQ